MELKEFISSDPRNPLEGEVLRLYHYIGGHWIDAFVNAHLKLSRVTDFNDIS